VLQGYNLIDLFIAAVLCVGLTLGLWKGFFRSLLGVLGLVAGVFFAVRYYGVVQSYLARVSSLDPLISTILSMVLIFVCVQVVFLIIRRIMKALIDLTKLGWVDRIFGACLGLAAGFCVVAGGVQVMLAGFPDVPLLKESKLIEPVDRLARRVMGVMPSGTKARLDAMIGKFKQFYETSPSSSPTKGSGSPKEPSTGPTSGPKKDTGTRWGGSGGS
jgi:membrane protein required for colicin V production